MTPQYSPLQQQVLAQINACYQHAEQLLQVSFPRPSVCFNQRGKAAGSARLQTNELRFNALLLQENSVHFIAHTVPHEVAHLIVYQLHGRTKPHGREWQTIMNQVFSLPATTTHSYDVSSVKGQTFRYACQCRDHQLSIRRHNKIVREQLSYQCRYCRQPLRPII